ncbi:MAG: hypothetical protein LBB90_06870 [Tannerella sp.]|jgi:hypothetical protein|nr:hypothetical protein [Tannerella sp.]
MKAVKTTDRQAKADWEVFYNNLIASAGADRNETETGRKERIARLESDFEEWKKYYFPKYCYAPAAPFHIKASRRILNNPEWYESRVWARELAKDALCMMETLYQTLTGSKKNILLISNSFDKAVELITPYRIVLEKNERIIADYGARQMPGNWTAGDFTTTQGVSFLAVGAGQSPRGSRKEEVRPDKVIISDIDTDEDVRNEEIIDKRWKWFEKAVFPTRSVSKDFQVIWLGNLIAQDCCVKRAMEKADKVDIVNLEDGAGNSTWPEKNTVEHIQRIKDKISTAAYQAEYVNNPLSEGKVFKEITWGKAPALSKFKFLVHYGDPAPSNRTNQKNSLKAQYLVGFFDGKYYVLTGFMAHMTNAQFVDCYYAIRDYVAGKSVVYNYIENNSLQDPFYEQVFLPLFDKASKEKGIIGIIPDGRKKTDKYSRIEGRLEPLVRLGKLIFNEVERNNPHMNALEDQFILFCPQMKDPAGADAIEGAVWKIDEKINELKPDAFHFGERRPHNKRF